MQELSNAELVSNLMYYHNNLVLTGTGSLDYNNTYVELISRLEAGDKAKQTIKELIPMIDRMLEGG